jgi:hypothetical protein
VASIIGTNGAPPEHQSRAPAATTIHQPSDLDDAIATVAHLSSSPVQACRHTSARALELLDARDARFDHVTECVPMSDRIDFLAGTAPVRG